MFSLSSILAAFKSNDHQDRLTTTSSDHDIKKSEETPKISKETTEGEKKPSPCCCCKPTKQARDACIVENGAENCTELIEAHRICMKSYGYEV